MNYLYALSIRICLIALTQLPWAIAQGYEGWHIDDVQVLVPAAQPAGFSVNDVSVTEGNTGTTPAVFTVSLSNPSSAPISVNFATADGTALAASDYAAASGSISFAPLETTPSIIPS